MNAIRKILTRNGNSLNVALPENFTARRVEVIVLPFEDNDIKAKAPNTEVFRVELARIFGKFNADISGFRFNRDELYDRA